MKKVSEKQLVANQKNAQKSSGPKTPTGKQISAQNSMKHGIHAKKTIINSAYYKENRYEYEELLESLYDELKPTTSLQEHLVIKIANCLWRARRAVIAETAIINNEIDSVGNSSRYNELTEQLDEIPELPYDPNIHDDMQEIRAEISQKRDNFVERQIIPRIEYNKNILHYEMRIDKQLSRAFRILNRVQARELEKDVDKVCGHPLGGF
ncbi:MAG: hypothetical protein GY853_10430 [PVC group bacterium]|nr:hypothetical protein [PVC group bacterium]